MNIAERHRKIVEIVQDEGQITIQDICKHFSVSDMTARRDLNALDRKGLLRRIHGGAVASLGRSYEPPLQTRQAKNLASKQAIGLKAAELIYNGESIAIDVGSTTMEIVPGLAHKRNLTIITNSMPIANLVMNSLFLESNIRLIVSGGIVRPREFSLVGHIPQQIYQEFHVDKAFIGIAGVSIKDGLTEYNIEDALIKRALLQSAREKIILADSSKFGVTTLTAVAGLEEIDKIVTDQNAPQEMIEEIQKLGVEVILTDQLGVAA